MCLMIDHMTKPTAYHYLLIPVPIHWQDDVEAGLDRDMRLGVLEPVPVNEPVTWCHRMVIWAKNGKPRRTIDFQSLNSHVTRKTHHTQSPFHKLNQFLIARKKQYLMLGMATLVSHSRLMITTLLHLLPHGADIDIILHPGDILLRGWLFKVLR